MLNEELKDDITVVIQGYTSFHPVHGMAFHIVDIDPEYTLGELAREKAETINKLKTEKIFSANKDTKLPSLPKTIAIISVETSKGYQDFLDVMKNNSAGYKFHHLLFPAILQGERAISTISRQLDAINKNNHTFDAVAIIRGGGGEIGLSYFDNYELAKKIALFPIPVLTGIGHSTNVTVSEMVSFESFITPTKIAEFILQRYQDFDSNLKDCTQKIFNQVQWIFKEQKSSLKDTARFYNSLTNRALDNSRFNLNQLLVQLINEKKNLINRERNQLEQMKQSLFSGVKNLLQETAGNIKFTDEKMRLLSPETILKRGYSITRHKGKIIKNPEELQENDLLETQLYQKIIYSRIEKQNTEK